MGRLAGRPPLQWRAPVPEGARSCETWARKHLQRRSLSWTRPAESLRRSAAWSVSSAAECSRRDAVRAPRRSARTAAGAKSTRSRISAARTSTRPARMLACRGLPVVGDDPVSLAEHVGERRDVEEGGHHLPGRTHGRRQPLPGRDRVAPGRSELALDPGHLDRLAFALHEQHAVELQGGRIVQVDRPFERAQRRSFVGCDHGPAVPEGVQRPAVALEEHGLLTGGRGVELLVVAMELGEVRHGLQERGSGALGDGHRRGEPGFGHGPAVVVRRRRDHVGMVEPRREERQGRTSPIRRRGIAMRVEGDGQRDATANGTPA